MSSGQLKVLTFEMLNPLACLAYLSRTKGRIQVEFKLWFMSGTTVVNGLMPLATNQIKLEVIGQALPEEG
jgi:hypothetical protein